jgi:hypothetical protein
MGKARIETPGFMPTRIPGCMLWTEADRGITLDGSDNVSALADQSANGRHFSQVTDAIRPGYSATGLNGLPCIMGALTKYLRNTSFGISAGLTGWTSIVVFQATQINVGYQTICTGGSPAVFQLQLYGTSFYTYVSDGTGRNGYCAFSSTDPTIAVCVFDGTQPTDATRLKLFLNGQQKTLSFSGAIPTQLAAISSAAIGAVTTGTSAFTGKMAVPGLMYSKAVSVQERQIIEQHYSRKYDIALV